MFSESFFIFTSFPHPIAVTKKFMIRKGAYRMKRWEKRTEANSLKELFMQNMGVNSLSEINEWVIKEREGSYRIDKLSEAAALARKFKDQPVTIVGDYDADGATSTSILLLGLKEYGFTNVSYKIPLRFTEGFGINDRIVDEIENGLIITCDNGIAGIEAIKKAKEKGLTVIVLDHHEAVVGDNGENIYPPADIIIDPSAIPGSADFTGYCGAGLCYRFMLELLSDQADFDRQTARMRYVGLAMIGTIGDVMTLHEENYAIVRAGLKTVGAYGTEGLRALITAAGLNASPKSTDIGFKIAPALNAMSRLKDNGALDMVKLLTFQGQSSEAMELAQGALKANEKRKALQKEVEAKAEKMISEGKALAECPLVVLIPEAHEGIIGITAGQLASKYNRPAIVMTAIRHEGRVLYKGSGRSAGDFDMKAVLDKHQSLIFSYGGHKGAAGLSVEPENLLKLANELSKDAYEADEAEVEYYDLEVKASDVGQMIEELKKYEPFGEGNPAPIFRVTEFKPLQKYGEYRKALGSAGVKLNGYGADALTFSAKAVVAAVPQASEMEFIGTLEDNEFRGNVTHQVVFSDIRESRRGA